MAIARFRGFLGEVNAFHGVRNIVSYSRTTNNFGQGSPGDVAARLLFRRISPIGDPTVSLVPLLDQWAREGHEVSKFKLTHIIKNLRAYKRYPHALQISMWMSERMNLELDSRDVIIRLDLISKVHGIEEAEKYFNNIPIYLRTNYVYGTLIHCYAHGKCVEKAETVVQKMKDLGMARTLLDYNALLSLYQQKCDYEKMESLTQEMEENQIRFNSHTYCILINACAAKFDTSKIDEILVEAESNDFSGNRWCVYVTAAEGYIEAGLMDKAVMSLRKAEKFVTRNDKRFNAYDFLMTLYAKAGYKNDVMRIWGIYKNRERVLNNGYMNIISSLLRLDDIENTEQVFEEWKSEKLSLDIRIPNFLIGYHCRKGFLEKAEAIIEEMISRGAKLNERTWYYMAKGYVQEGKCREAVEAMKNSLKLETVSGSYKLTVFKDVLEACLKFLKEEGNFEEAEELVGLLEQRGAISTDISRRLLQYIRGENQNLSVEEP